jgi:ArsR family transcriptional regulator
VLLLSQINELCVCELTDILDISQPVLSKQLAQLKKSHIVTSRRQGVWMFYQINTELPDWARRVIEDTTIGIASSLPFHNDLQQYQSIKQQCC